MILYLISILQWVDCVSQLLRMYPSAFEFSSAFMVDFLDCVLSCRFGNFFCNSEKERQQCGISEACGCLWAYLADLRASEGRSHVHYNLFYDPLKHADPLLPPAAALAPTLWPQFHLRWACPSEAQSGELEAQFRKMAVKFSELLKAKEVVERKAKEITTAMESLSAELRNEKQLSSLAMNHAKRASKENEAIKRAVQSLGCKVHFSNSGDCTVGIESNPTETPQKFFNSPSKREGDGTLQHDEKSDLSVSITLMADDVIPNNPIGRVCETLCPLRTRDGVCRWPDAGCAQLSSQFVGLKANFDAFDQLSIYDSYFQSE
jgi:myotubularin-related protein 1/2